MGEKKEKKIQSVQVGRRFDRIRQYFNYTRAQIAKIMGLSPVTYYRNEKGEQLPTTRSLMSRHTRLGVSLEWFLFERGPMLWQEVEEKLREEIKLGDLLSPELNEMVELMNKIPMPNHSLMLHFQEFKQQHKALILETLETAKNEPAPPVLS